MKAKIKENKKNATEESQYKLGTLYIQKSVGTVILCDRNSDCLRGICIIPGEGIAYDGAAHFIGEYRADWACTFTKFDGTIIMTEE